MAAAAFWFCGCLTRTETDQLEVVKNAEHVERTRKPYHPPGRQGQGSCTEKQTKRRHLVLNMDVNKTILMRDKVSNKDVKEIVNEVLSDAVWGVVTEGRWTSIVSEPTVHRPSQEAHAEKDIMSYNEWLAIEFPGAKNKKLRNQKAGVFTDAGEPGAALVRHTVWLSNNLKNPDGSPVQIIPAFFELMLSLKRDKRSFTICFRTFGEDLEAVVEELNTFCEGRHPLHPGKRMDGSDGETDYRIRPGDPEKCATYYREDSVTALALGTWLSPEREKEPSLSYYDSVPGVTVRKGSLQDVYEILKEKTSKPGAMALRDYFPYWKSKEMNSNGGKLLFYNCSPQAVTHNIFFDDNVRYSNAYIVDARPRESHIRVPFIASLLQSHVCRAEPLESIMDKQYFVKHVSRLEAGYDRKCKAHATFKRVLRLVRTLNRVDHAFMNAKDAAGNTNTSYDAWEGHRPSDRHLSINLDHAEAAR